MAEKIKLEELTLYTIHPIEGENYDDCQFSFGLHRIMDVDEEQCFRIEGSRTWWDSEGFDIRKFI